MGGGVGEKPPSVGIEAMGRRVWLVLAGLLALAFFTGAFSRVWTWVSEPPLCDVAAASGACS